MQQALTNLVMNGIQAMTGGGTLSVEIVGATTTRAAGPSPGAAGSTSPSGSGTRARALPPRRAAPDLRAVLHDEGRRRGHRPRPVRRPMASCREHGGWIDVESEPGRGQLRSPSTCRATRGGDRMSATRPGRRRRPRACASCSPTGLRAARLRGRCTTAPAAEALELLARDDFDVVVTDLQHARA